MMIRYYLSVFFISFNLIATQDDPNQKYWDTARRYFNAIKKTKDVPPPPQPVKIEKQPPAAGTPSQQDKTSQQSWFSRLQGLFLQANQQENHDSLDDASGIPVNYKKYNCKRCSNCPPVGEPIRCAEIMTQYWKDYAKQPNISKRWHNEDSCAVDNEHNRCHTILAHCAGVDANFDDCRALIAGVETDDIKFVEFLLKRKTNPNKDQAICKVRSYEMLDLFLEYGAKPNIRCDRCSDFFRDWQKSNNIPS